MSAANLKSPGHGHVTANALRFLLLPFSWLYAGAVIIRNKFFDWGFLRSEKLGAPTISVGNLSVGGTGKTPLVAYVVRYLQRKGKRVAILSRGYKRKSVGFVLVSDGKRILADAAQSGDEPQELAQHLPGVIVAVEENRARVGRDANPNLYRGGRERVRLLSRALARAAGVDRGGARSVLL